MEPEDFSTGVRRAIGRILGDTRAMITLATRLPLGGPAPELPRALTAMPIAGMAVGLAAGVVAAIGFALGLSPLASAVAATAATVWLTGALHEDGLADTADGFGGGGDREAKLAIMRDSRIGTYGVAALTLALIARIALIAALIAGPGVVAAALALGAAGALSRAGAVHALWVLPPARTDGLGAAAGRPDHGVVAGGSIVALAGAVILVWPAIGLLAAGAGIVGAACAALAVERLAMAQIGGQTGDVCGALQQAAEIACLAGIVIGAG